MKIQIDPTLPKMAFKKYGLIKQFLKLEEEINELNSSIYMTQNFLDEIADCMIVLASIGTSFRTVEHLNQTIENKLLKMKNKYFDGVVNEQI